MTKQPTEDGLTVCANPVFILGSPRSGTSALAWALAHHSQFWTSSENQLILKLHAREEPWTAFQQASGPGTWLGEQGVDHSEFLSHFGLGLNSLFTSRSGGRRWIDQTPEHTLMADVLAEMFPGASFLHIIRDGRRVVHSMTHFADSAGRHLAELPLWATSFREAVRTWRLFVESAQSFCSRHPARTLTVVHEELVTNPDMVFEVILDFLMVPNEPTPANFLRYSRINSSFAGDKWGTGPGTTPPSSGPDPVIDASPWEAWSAEERQIFVEEAGP